jgi:hypothetical protein
MKLTYIALLASRCATPLPLHEQRILTHNHSAFAAPLVQRQASGVPIVLFPSPTPSLSTLPSKHTWQGGF